MAGSQSWSRIGWHGIALDVPEDWCPGRIEGDYANGYLRVEDELSVRLELRWETARRRLPSATQLVDNYVKQTRKKTRRKAGEPEVDRGRSVPQLAAVDHEAFTWRGGFSAHSLLLVDAPSRRVVHLRVFFEEGKERRKLARHIFASVRTSSEDGLDQWGAFGLLFNVGSSWRLEQSALRTGCLQFVFHSGGDELEIVRLSLAEITLRKAPLDKWLESFFAKALRSFRYTLSEDEHHGHPAVRCEGIQRLRARPLGFFRRRRHVSALAWHCELSDKIFAVRMISNRPGDPHVDAYATSIACH